MEAVEIKFDIPQADEQRVRVCSSFPTGLTDAQFAALTHLEQQRWDWHVIARGVCVLEQSMQTKSG